MDFRDIIPESDMAAYAKAQYGKRAGFGSKPALLIIDMTYAFVDPSYVQASGNMGWNAVKHIKPLLDEARKKKIPVIYTTGVSKRHPTDNISRKRAILDINPMEKPRSNDIVDELKPLDNEIVIAKSKASAFWGTKLASILAYYNVDTVIVTGATTSGCVRATVVDAASYSYFVIVPEECAADRAVVPHKVNLFDMDMKYADVIPASEVLTYLRSL